MQPMQGTHLQLARLLSTIALATAGVSALAGCGDDPLHADTSFPVAPDAQIVAETELQGDFGPQYNRYLVILGDAGLTAKELAHQETGLVRRLGWRRHGGCDESGCWGFPPEDYVTYQPARWPLEHRRIPDEVAKLVKSTPGPMRRKLVVQLSPPESETYE
jgi:hypothetical protein